MLKRFIPENLYSFYFMVGGSLVFYIIGYSLSFIGSILVTRHLGPEGRGLVTSITAFISIGAVFAQVGMTHVNKLIAAEKKEAVGTLFLINIVICFAASVIIIPLIYWFGRTPDLGGENTALFISGLAFIPLFAISGACGDILIGMHWNKQYNSLFLAEKAVYAALIIVLVAAGFMTPATALGLVYLSQILRIALFCFFLRGHLSPAKWREIKLLKLDKNFLLANYLSSICFTFSGSILPILLNRFSNLEEVGYFAVAQIITNMLMILPTLYSSFAINRLVYERKKPGYIKTKFVLITSIMAFMTLLALVFYFAGNWLIPLLFGQPFLFAAPCLKHMLPGIIFLAGYQIVNATLIAERRNKNLLFLSIIYALSPALLPLLLFPLNAVRIADVYSLTCFITFMAAVFLHKDFFWNKVYSGRKLFRK